MAQAITLPTSSGVISQTGLAGSYCNVRGFAVRSGSGAISINIRENGSASGQIVLPLYIAATNSAGDVWSAPIVAKAPLYCEIVSGTGQDAVLYVD